MSPIPYERYEMIFNLVGRILGVLLLAALVLGVGPFLIRAYIVYIDWVFNNG